MYNIDGFGSRNVFSASASRGFVFGNGAVLPPAKIGDESLTLEQAGLLNGTLVQMRST